MAINKGICFTGEVGLSGEIRPVPNTHQPYAEAAKLGFDSIVVPARNLKGIKTDAINIKIIEVARVEEAFRYLFG